MAASAHSLCADNAHRCRWPDMTDTKHETGDDWAAGDPTQRYDDVVVGRKSMRGYTKQPVPMHMKLTLMADVVGLAMHSLLGKGRLAS